MYCNIALHAERQGRSRREIGFEFASLPHRGMKVVRLNTGSLTPHHIRTLLPRLPRQRDFDYRAFMRSASAENKALQEALRICGDQLPTLTLGLGVEFPSDRMWRYVGKGFQKEEVLETLRICADHNIRANANFILGWNNLTEPDLEEMERFFEDMPAGGFANAQVRWLMAHPHTEAHERYRGDEIRVGPFYLGINVVIDPEQLRLNRAAGKLIQEFGRSKGFEVDLDPESAALLHSDGNRLFPASGHAK